MSDTENNTELTYRLSLRIARLLESESKKRKELFDLIKDFYKYRSNIAHGSNLSKMNEKQEENLNKVLRQMPEIVANSILRLLKVAPVNMKDNELKNFWKEFWKDIELSENFHSSKQTEKENTDSA